MRYVRTVVVCLAVALAVAAVVSSTAGATAPQWFECAEVSGTGGWKDEGCSEADGTKKSNYERMQTVISKFTGLGHEVKLEASTNVITCKEVTTSGEIEAPGVAKDVVTKLFGCRGEEKLTKKTCEVKSLKPEGGKEQIVFNALKGELGKVSKTEATSETGLLLGPESGTTLSELEGSCLTVTKPVLKGSFISEVTPAGKTTEVGEFKDAVVEKKQKIQKFEGGPQKVIRINFSGEPEVQLADAEKITYEEALIGVGEQVVQRPAFKFHWKVEGKELDNIGETATIWGLKATVAGFTIEGKVGPELYRVKCNTVITPAGTKNEILGKTPGELEFTLEMTGCTMPAPANCGVEGGKIRTSALDGEIGEGVGFSAGRPLIAVWDGTNFMVIKAVNSGGLCAVVGNITVDGTLLAEAENPSMELLIRDFIFEPRVKRNYTTLTGGARTRTYRSGLKVGSEETTITGTIFFEAIEGMVVLPFSLV
jgi:hypothetical protein